MQSTTTPKWRKDLDSFAQYVKPAHTITAVAEYHSRYHIIYHAGKRQMRKTVYKD